MSLREQAWIEYLRKPRGVYVECVLQEAECDEEGYIDSVTENGIVTLVDDLVDKKQASHFHVSDLILVSEKNE